MIQGFLKGVNGRRVAASASSIGLLTALVLPSGALALENNVISEPEPDVTSVAYWCGSSTGGVKFDTGAIGTHSEGPIKITIVDENPDRVSDVVDDGTVLVYRVIVNGDGTGNAGNGNNDYPYPTKQDLVPPVPIVTDIDPEIDDLDDSETVERVEQPDRVPINDTDINWVITCFRAVASDTDDQDQQEESGDVLGATTDESDQSGGEVLGAEQLANTGVPAGVVSVVGVVTALAAFSLLRPSTQVLDRD